MNIRDHIYLGVKKSVVALSNYLRAHQGRARYEVASSTVAKAGPLIARDGRPVLMLTSLGALDDILKGLKLGANGYLTKPAKSKALLDAIKQVLA